MLIAGPLAGGGLIAVNLLGLGWRAIFLVNVPIGIAALAAGIKHLPDGPPATPHARLDMPSVALAAAAGFALVYPLIQGRQDGWPAWSFAVLVAGVAIVGAFALRQSARVRSGHAALVVPTILRRRGYVAGLVVALGFLGGMGGMTLALNVMYQAGMASRRLTCCLPRWRSRCWRSRVRSHPRSCSRSSAARPCTPASR